MNFKKTNSNEEVVSVTYEEIGLFPRSFSRVTDRFLQQIFSDVENLIIHEYRFYRYLFFTTLKSILILFFVPILINLFAKNYFVRPLTEYLWNSKQTEIFLNNYQQKRAFLELKDFEEKLYFESLLSLDINDSFINPENEKLINLENNFKIHKSFNNKDFQIDNPGENQNQNPGNFKNKLIDLNFFLTKKNNNFQINESFNFFKSTLVTYKNEKFDSLENFENNYLNQNKEKLDLKVLNSKNFIKKIKIIPIKVNHRIKKNLKNLIYLSSNQFILREIYKNFSFKSFQKMNFKKDTFYIKFNDKNSIEKKKSPVLKLHEKTIELAIKYNNISIEAITNFFSDLISFLTLCYLLFALEIQVNITKSFLLEVFFGLDDSKKSLLILLVTDLLVGYHSSNIWELFFEFIFDHYGFAESQTGVFLLVATLPVLLDVLFKYLIFRHLNRSSPATVATYHAMIE